jgi:hypothetical protein
VHPYPILKAYKQALWNEVECLIKTKIFKKS